MLFCRAEATFFCDRIYVEGFKRRRWVVNTKRFTLNLIRFTAGAKISLESFGLFFDSVVPLSVDMCSTCK